MKSFVPIALLFIFTSFGSVREPLQPIDKNSAAYRWLHKEVLESKNLDDMEDLSTWEGFTVGAEEVVDARLVQKRKDAGNVADISITKEKFKSGSSSLLLKTPTRLPGIAPKNGRGWGRSGIRRQLHGQDWSAFNRISIWIYPELPGFYTAALDIHLFNDGVKKIPALFGQEGETSLVLRNHEWNHIVWEISNVERDKMTAMEISYGLSGSATEEGDSIEFYFDKFDLEKVEPDKIEGWDVWNGRISYCHDGYATGAIKSAMIDNSGAKEFSLINQDNGAVVLTKSIEQKTTLLGKFQTMDFSEVRKSGNYILKAGDVSTNPFPIAENIWEASIWKALNFFYMERCGFSVPGVHAACHRDWASTHGDKKIIINGGWHDAGDLTQGLGNTAEIEYGLFALAEKLQERNDNPELYARVIEEARWGLDWILKTSFGDGFRNVGSISSRRTNDILGDDDDIISDARNNPLDNLMAAASEAIGARVLKDSDPRLAAFALKRAEADWQFGIDGMAKAKPSSELWTGTFDSNNIEFIDAAEAILAGMDIYKITGNKMYSEKSIALANIILNCQQKKYTDWDIPMTGFFYATTARDRILHFVHRGREQSHVLALNELCKAFPNHPDYMKWYSAIKLYAEYNKTIAKYTEPYGVMPASIYHENEYKGVPESRKEYFRQQVLNGIPLGKGYYLRLFPVWMDYRGHFGTILPQAQALASAAHLCNDLAASQLANHQLEWILGRNPFSQSCMYGEGYDFPPLYSPSSGDMVGGLPVGIQTRGDNDVPYWPVQSTWTYKEIWVHPVARWVWLISDLFGPALVEGTAPSTIIFEDQKTNQKITLQPDPLTKKYKIKLPEGNYIIHYEKEVIYQTLIAGENLHLNFGIKESMNFEVSHNYNSKNGEMVIKVIAHGGGSHQLKLRADNLSFTDGVKQFRLKAGETKVIEWHAKITSKDTPWVAVVMGDDDIKQQKEVTNIESEKL